MPRRADPRKIYETQRAGVFMRLAQNERLSEGDAEEWLARWEAEAEASGHSRGSADYWDAAWRWVLAQFQFELSHYRRSPIASAPPWSRPTSRARNGIAHFERNATHCAGVTQTTLWHYLE
jgi:hypothetical protein